MEEAVEYPIGHRRRRADGIPLLQEKFERNLGRRFSGGQQAKILRASEDAAVLDAMPVSTYVDLFVPRNAGDV